MIRFLIVSTILLVGFFSLGMRFATADPIHQTHYNVGYNDGLKNAESNSKHCHGHNSSGLIFSSWSLSLRSSDDDIRLFHINKHVLKKYLCVF